MAINFCNVRHKPEIKCNKIASDGYEVTNLVSEDSSCKKRGFLGASFITPPVEIIVKFPHPIDLSHVTLNLQNTSQKTTAFKLYTDTDEGNNFHLIATCDNATDSKLYLYNNRYKASSWFKKFSCHKPKGVKLYPRQDSHVANVQYFKIVLLKTARSSVPVLSNLELWGQPGIGCSSNLKMEIYETELKARNYTKSPAKPSVSDSCKGTTDKSDSNPVEPPAEFLDALTYEMMCQPILLPSGNNIDHQTLDKYIETSASWGRLPGDPFTGIPFSKTHQPMSNIELKTRIDHFWLVNPSSCSGGRCIGTSKSLKFYQDSLPTSSGIIQETPCTSYQPSIKRRLDNSINNATSFKKSRLTLTDTTHSQELARSLKESLYSVLKDRPSYLNPVQPTLEISDKCIVCESNNSSLEIYSLPCQHLLCRKCLLDQKKENVCKVCHATFRTNEVVRFHG